MIGPHQLRNPLICGLVLAASGSLIYSDSHAQPRTAYPAKLIRMIVAYAAGGPTDIRGE